MHGCPCSNTAVLVFPPPRRLLYSSALARDSLSWFDLFLLRCEKLQPSSTLSSVSPLCAPTMSRDQTSTYSSCLPQAQIELDTAQNQVKITSDLFKKKTIMSLQNPSLFRTLSLLSIGTTSKVLTQATRRNLRKSIPITVAPGMCFRRF